MTITFAVEQRMRFIDFVLHHYGSVARAEIEDFFGIGPATATRDLALYKRLIPGNIVLNQASKRYIRTDTFVRLYPL